MRRNGFVRSNGNFFRIRSAVSTSFASRKIDTDDKGKLLSAVEAILGGYAAGTRFGIRQDGDGLLACGVPGSQLTWMDARIGDWTVTPRVGKPVEVNALWINALHIGAKFSPRWQDESN